ncbi:MAG: oligosaccharide flippase family protein [Proteobacteria bacterium]|nr:oligosaccharide flippase family protein [Pseudomonadota bacterium]
MSQEHPPAESVRSRYAVTLSAQIFRLLLSVVTAAIVPRALGPAVYGNYNFLLSTSAALRGFLDNGTQQAFFTFSSQERASGPLTRLYARALALQFGIVVVLVAVAAATGKTDWLWRAQRLDQIVLVTLLDWALFLVLSLQQLGDSKGLTSYLQLTTAAVSLVTLLALLLLRFTGQLDFYTFVSVNLAGAVLTCLTLGRRLLWRERARFWDGVQGTGAYVARWWRFTKPLLLIQYYLPVVGYLGLYLIQKWYGSEEQGYYALALQWSAFAMVFTTSGVWIFWREVAHHSASDNLQHAARTYEQFSRLFFLLALVLSCGLSAGSGLLVQVVAGPRFQAATGVVAIMAFYPLSQTINQLTMASMKAMERTATYARWSIVLSFPDLLLTYILLAPGDAAVPGLHLGATGMAIKTALFGLLTSQVYDWINCRFLKIEFAPTVARKGAAVIAVGTLAVVLLACGGAFLQRLGMGVGALCVASLAYGAAVAALILLWPGLAGMTRAQLVRFATPAAWR